MTKPERKPYIFYLPDDTGEFVTTDALADGAVTIEKLSRDVKDAVNSIQNKADKSGTYPDIVAGYANNLLPLHQSPVVGEYLYRTAGGELDIAEGNAEIASIKGNTVTWNQWTKNVSKSSTIGGLSLSIANGKLTVGAGTSTSTAVWYAWGELTAAYMPVKTGDKILLMNKGNPAGGAISLQLVTSDNTALYTMTAESHIYTSTATAICVPRILVTTGKEIAAAEMYPMVINLTAMFGAGNEPSTVAEFEALFPLDYYAYDAGSLLSVNMQGIETVGFNAYDNATGTAQLLGGHKYQITGSYTALSYRDINGDTETITVVSTEFTPTNNGTLTVTGGDSTTCVHLVWSGSRNGEYEPYWSSELAIPVSTYYPTGMKSAGSAYDELKADEAVTRIGSIVVDGTNLAFSRKQKQSNDMWVAYMTLDDRATHAANAYIKSNYSDIQSYITDCAANVGSILVSSNNTLCLGVGARTDGDAALAAANAIVTAKPLVVYYDLATPTTTQIDPPLNLAYKVSDFGTERIIVDTTQPAPQSAPPIVNTIYGMNAVDVIRRLPVEYISHASFENFTAALATYLEATITETWDSSNNEYDYAIEAAADAQEDLQEVVEPLADEIEEEPEEEAAEEIEETAEEEAR